MCPCLCVSVANVCTHGHKFSQESRIIAFAMYNGVVNTWMTSGNWKRMYKIANQGIPHKIKHTEHHRMRRKSGVFNLWDVQSASFSGNQIDFEKRDRDTFWTQDSLAINAIASITCLQSANPLLITAGMDGFIRLFDSLDGSKCGQFDAGHFDDTPGPDGQYARLPVLSMASVPSSQLMGTSSNRGRIKIFNLVTATEEVITLRLSVIRAMGLIGADADGMSDPYVKIVFKAGASHCRQDVKTANKFKTLDPVWDEDFTFTMGSGRRHDIMKHHWHLQFTVLDYDRYGGHDEIGSAQFDVTGLSFGKAKKTWLHLSDPNPEPGKVPKPHGTLYIEVCLNVEFNKPEVFSEWQAHEGSILEMDLTRPSTTTDGSPVPLLVSCGVDNKIKVWSLSGILIGSLGQTTWTNKSFVEAKNAGQRRRAELLMEKEEAQQELIALEKKLQRVALEQKRSSEANSDELEAKKEETERVAAKKQAKKEYIKRLENSDDVNERVNAVSEKMGIPDDTYNGKNWYPFADYIIN